MTSRLDKLEHKKIVFNQVKKTDSEKQSKKIMKPQDAYDTIGLHLIDTDTNIRQQYDDEDIKELSESMKKYGQLEPVLVYDNDKTGKYTIIFGHRRHLAAQIAGLKDLKCIITKKPDKLENILFQAVENEHSVKISSSDRERYVKILNKEFNLSPAEIAEKLGKSENWVYTALKAEKIRKKHESNFNKAGITMTTEDTRFLKDASREEVKEALEEILENPGNKGKILKELNRKTKNNKNEKRIIRENNNSHKEKEKERAPIVRFDDIESSESFEPQNGIKTDIKSSDSDLCDDKQIFDNFKKFNINTSFYCDVSVKRIKYTINYFGEVFDKNILEIINNNLIKYFNNEGYKIEE